MYIRILLTIFAILLFSQSAVGQSSQLKTLLDKTENYNRTARMLVSNKAEIAAHIAERDRASTESKRRYWQNEVTNAAMRRGILERRLEQAEKERISAYSNYEKAMRPIVELTKQAIQARDEIAAIPDQGDLSIKRSKQNALATINRDLVKLLNIHIGRDTQSWNELDKFIRSSRDTRLVQDRINTIFASNPLEKLLASKAWSNAIGDAVDQYGASEIQEYYKVLGHAANAVKLGRVIGQDKIAGPLDLDAFERLLLLTDLMGAIPAPDALEASTPLALLKAQSEYARVIMTSMKKDLRDISVAQSKANLLMLRVNARSGKLSCPEGDAGWVPTVLFGGVERTAFIDVDQTAIEAGTIVSGKWCKPQYPKSVPSDSGWIGMFGTKPSDIKREQSSDAKYGNVSKGMAAAHLGFGDRNGGEFSFRTDGDWPTGTVKVKMYSSDSTAGRLIAEKSIQLEGCGSKKTFKLNKLSFREGEDIHIRFCNLEYDRRASNGFLIVLPKGTDRHSWVGHEWYYSQGPTGQTTFTRDLAPGTYVARYQQDYNSNDYKIFQEVEFEIVGQPLIEGTWRVDEGTFEGLKIKFENTETGYMGIVIGTNLKFERLGYPLGSLVYKNMNPINPNHYRGVCRPDFTSSLLSTNVHLTVEDKTSLHCPQRAAATRVGR